MAEHFLEICMELTSPDDSNLEIKEAKSLDLLPRKSRQLYEKKYEEFIKWCSKKQESKITENLLLSYLKQKSKVMKSPSLWSTYSMLKATIKVKNDIDIKTFHKLSEFLKSQSVGYSPKPSKTLSHDEIGKFLFEAPDSEFLMKKVVLIVGVVGACRRNELVEITTDDIEDNVFDMVVTIPDSKNKVGRKFSINNNTLSSSGYNVDCYTICKKYSDLRPENPTTNHFFLNYCKGVCSNAAVGKNTIAKIPKDVADFLGLPQAEEYTAHCFRRTSITLGLSVGQCKAEDFARLKSHGIHKSSAVVAGCVDATLQTKNESLTFFENLGLQNRIAIKSDDQQLGIDLLMETSEINTKGMELCAPSSEICDTEITTDLLPLRSKELYEKKYKDFMKWCSKNQENQITENVLLDYLQDKAKIMKSPSLWSTYSMLKATIKIKNDIDIKTFHKLTEFLKRQSVGYEPIKSKTFSRENISKFLLEAPDSEFLMKKVVLIFGIAGACRRNELLKMTAEDIEDHGSVIVVTIPNCKSREGRRFIITNDNENTGGPHVDCLSICRKYFNLRPKNLPKDHLFLNYIKGVCTKFAVGKNSIAKISKDIADFLGLPQADEYSGHCFRQTSLELSVCKGGDVTRLKSHIVKKTSAVVEDFVDVNLETKDCTGHENLGFQKQTATVSESQQCESVLMKPVEIKRTGKKVSLSSQNNCNIEKEITLESLPLKSRELYENKYEHFMKWCSKKGVDEVTESVLLTYLKQKAEVMKSSSLWSIYSMLKATLKVKKDIDIKTFPKLSEFLKSQAVGYKPKKSKTFSRDDLCKFLLEAPDSEFLLEKVVLIFGIAGACRSNELVKMTTENIEDLVTVIMVKIPDSKSKAGRMFTITNDNNRIGGPNVDILAICHKYLNSRPKSAATNRLFLNYCKGMCSNFAVGKNNIAKTPKYVADYLGLPEAEEYTGHCFRQTSATLLVRWKEKQY